MPPNLPASQYGLLIDLKDKFNCLCMALIQLMYMLLSAGTVPFKAHSILGLYDEICNSPLKFPNDVHVSDSLKHLLQRMLDKDPATRIHLSTVMRHPWSTYNDELPLLPPVLFKIAKCL